MTSALDRVPGGILVLSADLRITAVNRSIAELAGRTEAELIGEPVDILLSGPSRILFQTHVYPALRADGRVEEVFLTLAPAGGTGPTPVLFNAVRRGPAGEAAVEGPLAVIAEMSRDAVFYDALIVRIRARSRWESHLLATTKELERQRAESRSLAEELSTANGELRQLATDEARTRAFRDAFIGIIGHELRTPITTIFGMAHVLRRRHRTMDPEVVEEHLRDIAEESDRLRRLTEDLLVLSRAEGGHLDIATEPIILPRLVERAVEEERARSPSHHIVVESIPRAPLVLAEETYVGQTIRNYLGNATKYSPAGTEIRVELRSEDGGMATRVIDDGPGLPPDPAKLFELFYRDLTIVGQKPGAGIGLFVCRELITAMGGRVWASAPESGHGSEFGFWLPQA
ncbi:MAG: ATP-binding protein [Candidatus Limnocylindria bacterium]